MRVDFTSAPVGVGDRVQMIGIMEDDPAPLELGAEGTVTSVSKFQIMVDWDSGRTLILLPEDPFRVIARH